ncbi:MAG: SPFH/Band 7/PHB domain protein [Lachnospiraceae bacterium]|nr:SPFH/Band 7/PHB domain protein [Lachnospiraceae bacterium]
MYRNIFLIILVIFILVIILSWIVIVPEKQEVIVEMLGKYHKTMRAGVNFKLPIIQTIRNRVSLKEHIHDFPPQSVITKDNVTMKIDTVVYCKVFDSYKNTYMIQNGVDAIEKITATTLRNIVGTMELDELLTARDKINSHLLKEVDEATDVWGIKITRIEIKDIIPPAEIKEAMDRQMKAEREKRATILEAEAIRQRDITVAEGKRDAMLMEAEAKAKSIALVAEAEAEAVKLINEQKPSDAYIKLEAIKSVEKLANGHATKIVVPSDIASITSGIVAMKEVLADAKKEH